MDTPQHRGELLKQAIYAGGWTLEEFAGYVTEQTGRKMHMRTVHTWVHNEYTPPRVRLLKVIGLLPEHYWARLAEAYDLPLEDISSQTRRTPLLNADAFELRLQEIRKEFDAALEEMRRFYESR